MAPLHNIHTVFRALFFLVKETSIFYVGTSRELHFVTYMSILYNIDERGLACSAEKCDRFIYEFWLLAVAQICF
jgi:hypothetical protein